MDETQQPIRRYYANGWPAPQRDPDFDARVTKSLGLVERHDWRDADSEYNTVYCYRCMKTSGDWSSVAEMTESDPGPCYPDSFAGDFVRLCKAIGVETKYKSFIEGMIAGIRNDGPPVALMLWPALLEPINQVLAQYTDIEMLTGLRAAAALQPDTPPAVLDAIDAYIQLYRTIEKL